MEELYKLNGADELEKVLKELPRAVAGKVVLGATRSGAAILRKVIRKNAPYDPKRKRGKHLRDTIRAQKKHRTNDLYLVGPTHEAPHAHLVTHGTGPRKFKKPHRVKLGSKTVRVTHSGRMPANPYIQNSAAEARQSVFDKIGHRLGDLIEKAATKLAGRYKTSGAAPGRRFRR